MWADHPRLDGSTALHVSFQENLEEAAISYWNMEPTPSLRTTKEGPLKTLRALFIHKSESVACLLLYEKMEEKSWDDDINILEDR
jgi:hypothetical protein